MKRDASLSWKSGVLIILPALLYVAVGMLLRWLFRVLAPGIDPMWSTMALAALTVVVYSRIRPKKREARKDARGAWALCLLSALAVGLCFNTFPALRQWEPVTALSLLGYGMAAPIAEELVYRGLVLRRGKDFMGFYPALMISAALFAAAHVQPGRVLASLIFGLLLGLLYDRCRTLWAPVVVHSAVNLLSFVLPREIPRFTGLIGGTVLLGILLFLVRKRSVKE